jgi:hypothetical protein
MAYVDIVTALAVLQFIVFGFRVGKARGRYGVRAPAITGNETCVRGRSSTHRALNFNINRL